MISYADLVAKHEKYGRFDNLHPTVEKAARALVKQAYDEGIPILIVQAYRSIAEQNALYAQGRTAPGAVVTNAKGGASYHNYGLAIDFALLSADGKSVSWSVNDKWRRVAAIGKSLGFKWGGDWRSFKDNPHLEMTFGLTIADLKAGKRPPAPKATKAEASKEAKRVEANVKYEGKAVEAFIEEGRTYVQLRDLAELLGLTLKYDNESKTVVVSK